MGKTFRKWFFPKVLKTRTNGVSAEILKEVGKAKSILDFGCGNMIVTKNIQDNVNGKVVGVEVLDLNLTDLEPVVYDGDKLPFKNNEFDLVYTVFVLHHCQEEIKALKEMLRVCKNRALIIEEIYNNSVEEFFTKINDWITNQFETPDINLPFNFHSDKEWKKIFNNLGWRVVKQRKVSIIPWLTRQKLYVLEKI